MHCGQDEDVEERRRGEASRRDVQGTVVGRSNGAAGAPRTQRASRAPAGPAEALVIAAILLFNALLGAGQERRAEHAMRQLRRLAAPQVWTLRDGLLQRLAVATLVPGDLVRLDAG